MENITKLSWVAWFRKIFDRLAVFPLPNINPSVVSVLSVLAMALIYIWPQNLTVVVLIVIFSVFLDWLDGLIARRYNRASLRGYRIDAICDRLSEGILCSLFFYPWFYLWLLNVVMTAISWHLRIHFMLSLRLLFLLAVLAKFLGYDVGFVN